MKQFFASFFGTIVGIFVAFLLVFIVIVAMISSAINSGKADKPFFVKNNSVLHIKLDHVITERGKKNPFENLDFSPFAAKGGIGLDQVIECFEKAKADSSIKGVYLELADVAAAAATLEEIRTALIDFKTSGKFVISYSEMYSQKSYYLASVADKIYMNPQGELEWKGLSAQVMFYKGALDKLEIDAQIFRHGKFKSAIEPFDLDKMSPANREQTMTYIGSIWNHMLEGISKYRKVSPEELNRIADGMLIRKAEDAVSFKLIDELKYEDEITVMLMEKTGVKEEKKMHYVELKDYVRAPFKKDRGLGKDKIAVIYAVGSIESGEGDDETIGSDRIAKAIRDARMDSTVKAIVLRVNSPGGSALASDVMWREVTLAKKVKPVIVSMGDYAASGGYYIACAADVIVAQPNTITGSIGVFGVLPNAQAFFNNKLGITIDTVNTNKHADMGSLFRPVSAEEGEVIQHSVEDVYTTFITRVAEGRKMTTAQVDSIGQGRVWSGVDAKKIGLVDELGGINVAIKLAAQKAKLDDYQIQQLPKAKDPLEEFLKGMNTQAKVDFMKEQLGDHYEHFKHMRKLMNVKGVQARMPYDVIIY
jgi:protease IV